MDRFNHQLIKNLLPSDPQLKKLYDQHRKLEREVENLERFTAYSSSARLRLNELKKLKLKGVESILNILKTATVNHSSVAV